MMEEIAIMSDSNSNDDLPIPRKSSLKTDFQSHLSDSNESGFFNETSRLQALELEQEQLNASLMALTTHFGQVQFRLKQIVSSPEEHKEQLLKELEEFAFRGCPDLNTLNRKNSSCQQSNIEHEIIIEEQRLKQKNLIDQLKEQLTDLENYAYQTGDLGGQLPSNLVIEKQKVIIDELKEKINLPLDNLNKFTNEELKKVVDNAIFQIVNPVKIKEQLVTQLKTQIEDLERFIDFLQGEATSPGPYLKKKQCNCSTQPQTQSQSAFPIFQQPSKSNSQEDNTLNSDQSQSTIDMLKKFLSIMQLFALTQLGCGTKSTFEKNSLKKTSNHWGKLKLTESDDELETCPHELVRAVRKDLSTSLRDLMQHGLVETSHGSSLVPFGCFVVRSKENQTQLHVWDLLLKYYEMKHGKEFTQSAANKLSQSFGLNVVAGKVITIKQSLLNAIETVMRIHKHDTSSSKDSCFKAFVCLALNEKKLVLYLKQILKTTLIIENYYSSWSYIKTTGFDDALKSLDQLKVLSSNLPVEKSTRRRSSNHNASSSNKDLF